MESQKGNLFRGRWTLELTDGYILQIEGRYLTEKQVEKIVKQIQTWKTTPNYQFEVPQDEFFSHLEVKHSKPWWRLPKTNLAKGDNFTSIPVFLILYLAALTIGLWYLEPNPYIRFGVWFMCVLLVGSCLVFSKQLENKHKNH